MRALLATIGVLAVALSISSGESLAEARGLPPSRSGRTSIEPDLRRVVRFMSERSELAAGGHLTRDSLTVLTAEVAPPLAGVEIEFRIIPGTGEGNAAPAMLSSERAVTGEQGVARTVLVSSDREEACRVVASVAGDLREALSLQVEFRRTLTELALVARAPPAFTVKSSGDTEEGGRPPPRDSLPGIRLGRSAARWAAQLADPAVEVRTAAKKILVSFGREAVLALVEVAGDPKFPPDARSLAVRTLAEIPDEEADEQILALLAHPLPDVRAGAEEAMSSMAPDRAEILAAGALARSDPFVRAAALRVLGRLARERGHSSETARHLMATALSDDDPFVRATAAWESAQSGGKEAEGALLRALADSSPFVRTVAGKGALFLSELHPSPALREAPRADGLSARLVEALSDGSPEVRCAAAKALALRHAAEAGPARSDPVSDELVRLFGDPDARVRRSVGLALSWRGDLRALRGLVDDPDPLARKIALRTFAESGTEAEVDLLVGMLDLEDRELVELSLKTLRRITCLDFRSAAGGSSQEIAKWKRWYIDHGHEARHDWLWQAVNAGSERAAEAALELARETRCPSPRASGPGSGLAELKEALVRLVSDAPPSASQGPAPPDFRRVSSRHAAAEALVLLGDSAGARALAEDMRSPSPYVRLSALKALGSGLEGGARSARSGLLRECGDALLAALEDPQSDVRRAAARLLQGLAGESFGYEAHSPSEHRARAIEEWKRWLEENTRAEAPR